MDLYGYCPRCRNNTGDFSDSTLCDSCEGVETCREELFGTAGLVFSLGLGARDSDFLEGLARQIKDFDRRYFLGQGRIESFGQEIPVVIAA